MNKQEKKIVKELEKEAKKLLKSHGKERNIKTISGINYKKQDEFFFDILPTVAYFNNEYILYSNINVKPYILDDLFWEVFDIESNKKAPMSLRANGAYVAPSIKIDLIKVVVDSKEKLEERCRDFLDEFDEKIEEFLKKSYDIESYYQFLKKNYKYEHDELLFILLEIQLKNYTKALEMLKIELAAKKRGGFGAGNKNIYEFAKEYCEERI